MYDNIRQNTTCQPRHITIIIAFVVLSACATPADMQKGLDRFVGHDVKDVVAKIGYPDSENVVLGDKVYVWGSRLSGSDVFPSTNAGMPATVVPYEHSCTVKVIADQSGRVKNYDFYGNYGGCERYAVALK